MPVTPWGERRKAGSGRMSPAGDADGGSMGGHAYTLVECPGALARATDVHYYGTVMGHCHNTLHEQKLVRKASLRTALAGHFRQAGWQSKFTTPSAPQRELCRFARFWENPCW